MRINHAKFSISHSLTDYVHDLILHWIERWTQDGEFVDFNYSYLQLKPNLHVAASLKSKIAGWIVKFSKSTELDDFCLLELW